MICVYLNLFPWFIWTLLSPASKKKNHQPMSIDKVMCLTILCQLLRMHLLTIALHFLQFYLTAFQMLIVIAMSGNVPAMPTGREDERVLYDAIVSKCLWWSTMNSKAHNFVFCNWLMMSSQEKKWSGGYFGGGGLAMSQQIQGKNYLKYTKHIKMEPLKNLWCLQ